MQIERMLDYRTSNSQSHPAGTLTEVRTRSINYCTLQLAPPPRYKRGWFWNGKFSRKAIGIHHWREPRADWSSRDCEHAEFAAYNGARRNNVNVAFAEISSVDNNAEKLNTPRYQVVELEHWFEIMWTAVTPYTQSTHVHKGIIEAWYSTWEDVPGRAPCVFAYGNLDRNRNL